MRSNRSIRRSGSSISERWPSRSSSSSGPAACRRGRSTENDLLGHCRTVAMEREGWRVLRFWANHVVQNPEGIWTEIALVLGDGGPPPPPPPPPRGGGGKKKKTK